MTYYKQINGIKYARNLIEAAERLTSGRGESRLSLDEIQEIVALAEDGPGITATELFTLRYITSNYILTDAADEWLQEQMKAIPEISFQDQLQQVLIEGFSLEELNLIFSEEEFQMQRINFGPQAKKASDLLREAIDVMLHDASRHTSVMNTLLETQKISQDQFEDQDAFEEAVQDLLIRFLQTSKIELLPSELPDHNPVDGEPIEENWLFFALLPELSKFGFFVIIPRKSDDQAYVYRAG